MEGLFFAISSARAILGPVSDMLMGAMNDKNTIRIVQSVVIHMVISVILRSIMISTAVAALLINALSVQEECNLYLDNQQESCPTICLRSAHRGLLQIHQRFGIFSHDC